MARPVKRDNKWRIRWIYHTGKRRSATFDSYRVAEEQLAIEKAKVAAIRRGLASPIDHSKTFADWLENKTRYKRSPKDDMSIINAHLMPAFGNCRLAEINHQAIDKFRSTKVALNAKAQATILILLISMLNLAKDLGWMANPPRIKKPKTPKFSKDLSLARTFPTFVMTMRFTAFWMQREWKARWFLHSMLQRYTPECAQVSWRGYTSEISTSMNG